MIEELVSTEEDYVKDLENCIAVRFTAVPTKVALIMLFLVLSQAGETTETIGCQNSGLHIFVYGSHLLGQQGSAEGVLALIYCHDRFRGKFNL